MGFIYKITNKISKKCYIGETTEENPEERWKRHKYAISKGTGCPALRDAVVKYGLENFTFEVLIICFDENRYDHEKEYIKKYNSVVPNGYNILEGGAGGGFNFIRTPREAGCPYKVSSTETHPLCGWVSDDSRENIILLK